MPWRTRQRCRALRDELGDALAQAAETSSSGSSVRRRNSTIIASSAAVSTVLWGRAAPWARPRSWFAPPLGHGLGAQPVAGGQAAGRLLRRLELGSNSRRCSGAAMKRPAIARPPHLGTTHHDSPGLHTYTRRDGVGGCALIAIEGQVRLFSASVLVRSGIRLFGRFHGALQPGRDRDRREARLARPRFRAAARCPSPPQDEGEREWRL